MFVWDMTFLDVTNLNINEGDRVEVFGPNRKIEDLAKEAYTIPYEILSCISQRVVRAVSYTHLRAHET